MYAIRKNFVCIRNDKDVMDADVISDSTPDALPETGENVTGMTEYEVFAPGSTLFVLDTDAEHQLYIADESGQFVPQ